MVERLRRLHARLRRAYLLALSRLPWRRRRDGSLPALEAPEGRLERREIQHGAHTLQVLAFDGIVIDPKRDPPSSAEEWLAAARAQSPRPTFPMATYLAATEKLRATATAYTQYLEGDADMAGGLAAQILGETPAESPSPPRDIVVRATCNKLT